MDAFESDAPLGCVALDLLPNALSLLQVGLVTYAQCLLGADGLGCRWLQGLAVRRNMHV